MIVLIQPLGCHTLINDSLSTYLVECSTALLFEVNDVNRDCVT